MKAMMAIIIFNHLGKTLNNTKEPIMDMNPYSVCMYKEELYREELKYKLVFDDTISESLKKRITDFVKEYQEVFRECGVRTPVHRYKIFINTGCHQKIAVKNFHCGLHKSPIIINTIKSFLELGHIRCDTTSLWGFSITLTSKPLQ